MRRWRCGGLLWFSALSLFGSGAGATPSCQGSYNATLLRPLPERVVVDLDIHDRSRRNLRLADRFIAGMRAAGVTVAQDPTVLLHVSTSRLRQTASGTARGAERKYPELYGMAGAGKQPQLPPMPPTGVPLRPSPPPAPLLVLRVDATEGKDTRIAWVASVQCRMTGTDEGLLAEELGRVIGGALGKRVEQQEL